MNKQIIFAFVAGMVSGAVPAALFLKGKYKAEAESEIEEMRKFYLEKEKKVVDKAVEKTEADTKKMLYEKIVEHYTPYNRMEASAEVTDPAEEEYPEEDEPEEEANERYARYMDEEEAYNRALGIREIDRDEFDEDDNSQVLYYYFDDDTLADEFGHVVDEDQLLGTILTDSDFKNALNNETVIYIRNGPLNAKYEVNKILDSYRESVGEGV